MNKNSAAYYIKHLNMTSHPEGGYYREVYRSGNVIQADKVLPGGYEGERNLATSICFLLEGYQFSAFHRLKSDELWYFHTGSPVQIYTINEEGELTKYLLGVDVVNGESPQVLLKQGVWFAAENVNPESFSLFGCTVAPGFDFRDFELAEREVLRKRYPQHDGIISRLTAGR